MGEWERGAKPSNPKLTNNRRLVSPHRVVAVILKGFEPTVGLESGNGSSGSFGFEEYRDSRKGVALKLREMMTEHMVCSLAIQPDGAVRR